MATRCILERLEPRNMLSGGAFDPHATAQAQSAFAIGNSTNLYATGNTIYGDGYGLYGNGIPYQGLPRTSVNSQVTLSFLVSTLDNPAPQLVVEQHGGPLMMIKPVIYGAGGMPPAGNASEEVRTSDRDAEPEAGLNSDAAPHPHDAHSTGVPAPRPTDEARAQGAADREQLAPVAPVTIVDRCFDVAAWEAPLDEVAAETPVEIHGTSELELLAMALSVSATAQLAAVQAPSNGGAERQPKLPRREAARN